MGLGPRWVLPPVYHLTWPTAGRGFQLPWPPRPAWHLESALLQSATPGPAPPRLTSGMLEAGAGNKVTSRVLRLRILRLAPAPFWQPLPDRT